jgi:general nucleoside transport system permease protein
VSDVLTGAFAISVATGMVRISTPLLFGALGELITERSGIMNLGVEGNMLVGAFAGFVTAHATGNLWLSILVAILAAGLAGLLMAFMSTTLKVDQTITGLAINLLASGMTFYLFRVIFSDVGSENLPTVPTFKTVAIPLLSEIPVVGRILFRQHMLTYIALMLVPVVGYFLHRTRPGLELRLMGENPRAADMRGIDVARHQYAAVTAGAMMAGVGGAFLTLASAGLFVPNISAGRGFIAFALVIFGNWSPVRILVGALFFGLIDSLQLQLQGVGVDVPHQLLLALPYVLTILVLLANRRRTRAPLALGIPYARGG